MIVCNGFFFTLILILMSLFSYLLKTKRYLILCLNRMSLVILPKLLRLAFYLFLFLWFPLSFSCLLRLFFLDSTQIFSLFLYAAATTLFNMQNMWDLTPDTELLSELPEEYGFETALADLIVRFFFWGRLWEFWHNRERKHYSNIVHILIITLLSVLF